MNECLYFGVRYDPKNLYKRRRETPVGEEPTLSYRGHDYLRREASREGYASRPPRIDRGPVHGGDADEDTADGLVAASGRRWSRRSQG